MSAELILNLINEVLDEKQLLPEEEAKTPEKLPPIKFPTLKFTERGIGKPGSEDRKMFERLMSGVKGGTVKEKLASIKEFNGYNLDKPDSWRDLFNYASQSDFLMGRSSQWSMDFDFVINKTNLLKIIEGNYDNGQ